MEIKGTYTALITPFNNEGVDHNGLRELINFQIQSGIDGLLLLGTTGEAPTLSWEEQEEVIKTAVDEIDGRVPLMVGTGTNATQKTIDNTKKAKRLGADIALIVTPYYNKPTDEGIYRHFEAITDNVDIPIVVYNIQGRTGKNIETTTLKRIAGLKNICGVKEASGNINQMMDVINNIAMVKPGFSVMCGDDALTLPLVALGGKGIISVASNIIPAVIVNMVNAALSGDFEDARKIHYDILPLMKGLFIETNPIPVKTVMNILNMPSGNVRLPLYEMSAENRYKLNEIVMGLKIFESKINA